MRTGIGIPDRMQENVILMTAAPQVTTGGGVTIHHYDSVCLQKYTYRRPGLMIQRHNGIMWSLHVCGLATVSRLCHAPNCNTIEHCCL
ncbi:hypothetical protein E2C01_090372 [Portunus trituberculatus]|uniref:Uncharacterized protein n=1 Tax=Portunus trituberculatus TaxID=210409 RepID=A0A5B7JGE1_PORTR|nr:hypothetical protein [Portunus trituberculatus]